MSLDAVIVARRGTAACLTINRPAQHNALSNEVLAGLRAAVRDAKSDPDVRSVVITDAGDRSFSAGGDLSQMSSSERNLDTQEGRCQLAGQPGSSSRGPTRRGGAHAVAAGRRSGSRGRPRLRPSGCRRATQGAAVASPCARRIVWVRRLPRTLTGKKLEMPVKQLLLAPTGQRWPLREASLCRLRWTNWLTGRSGSGRTADRCRAGWRNGPTWTTNTSSSSGAWK